MQKPASQGFTLAELAIALAVVSLILGSGLALVPGLHDAIRYRATQQRLETARDALIGFALVQGRLPCPATATSKGQEMPLGGGVCHNPYDGLLPAATLGLNDIDAEGFLSDAWGHGPGYRIRYAVSTIRDSAFTTPDKLAQLAANPGLGAIEADLQICDLENGGSVAEPDNCGNTLKLSGNAVAVLYSTGPNGGKNGGMAEQINPHFHGGHADKVFGRRSRSEADTPGGEFDDQLLWLAWPELALRLVVSGRI